MLKLYNYPRSGNSYKIRLFLSLIARPYVCEDIDLPGGGTSAPSFLELNPRGQVPVLMDGEEIIWDSMAILVYLARQYADASWFPEAPLAQARVMQWLAVSENEILYGLARARAIRVLNRPFDPDECKAMGTAALKLLEQQLGKQHWLAADHPTIADIACYPYVALAPEGDISLESYTAIKAWMNRIRALSGYIGMQGID
jgi:glutathione S-transferase